MSSDETHEAEGSTQRCFLRCQHYGAIIAAPSFRASDHDSNKPGHVDRRSAAARRIALPRCRCENRRYRRREPRALRRRRASRSRRADNSRPLARSRNRHGRLRQCLFHAAGCGPQRAGLARRLARRFGAERRQLRRICRRRRGNDRARRVSSRRDATAVRRHGDGHTRGRAELVVRRPARRSHRQPRGAGYAAAFRARHGSPQRHRTHAARADAGSRFRSVRGATRQSASQRPSAIAVISSSTSSRARCSSRRIFRSAW